MENKEFVYVLAFDGTGYVQFYKVKETSLEDLLIELDSEGKLFTVVSNKIEDDTLVLSAKNS